MNSIPRVHRGLGFLFLGLAVLQFFLAGLGVFGDGLGSSDYDAHTIVGSLLMLLALILLILAAIGRREALATSGVLLVLMIIQSVLANIGNDASVVAALHPLNGLLILGVAGLTARGMPLPVGGHGHRASDRSTGTGSER